MISIRADERRDIGLAADGRLALVEGLEAVTQNCLTAMSAQRGEMVLAADEGVPTRATVWDKYRPAIFEAAARRTLEAVEGVTGVTGFQMNRDENTLHYTARIRTQYGEIAVINRTSET
ncbi:MAG: DUF2634 domain-containing protein [Azoarcus sp.]|jgi:hypothetical protein|nr:DUF2634 domain-containing protein [Azoarcus sp.]